ncbi:MAG TPA: hypothetical protein VJ276_18320 [Thermoanaerobaculia bacterium]|nr:hypothetical protein [Thermoanaerobaculia bacterium]
MRYFVEKEAQFGAQKRCAVGGAEHAPARRAMCSIVIRAARTTPRRMRGARIVRSAAATHPRMRIFGL